MVSTKTSVQAEARRRARLVKAALNVQRAKHDRYVNALAIRRGRVHAAAPSMEGTHSGIRQ